MSTLKISLLTILILILSFLLILGNQEADSTIVSISSILSGLCSVATFVIALLLYQRFGIDNTIIENKALTVFKLIDLVKSKSFNLEGHPEFKNVWINFHRFESLKASYPQMNAVLLLSESYYKAVDEIVTMSNSVFMPIEIGTAIKGIELHALGKPTVSDEIAYCKLSPFQKEGSASKTDAVASHPESWGTFNAQDLTLSEFLDRWDKVIESINVWLKKNTDGQTLNISPLPDRR
jgi:hypothetical protein